MGGYDGTTRLNTCEFYNPDTDTWSEGPQMVKRRSGADAATGPDGSIYVVGGTDGIMQHSSVEKVRAELSAAHRYQHLLTLSSRLLPACLSS